MSYTLLRKISYGNQDDYEKEVNSRLNNPLSLKTGLDIVPFNREQKVFGTHFELFYLPVLEISLLKDCLVANSKKIIQLQESLPEIANEKVLISKLIEEIKSTNDIEGIESTRQEIGEAIDDFLINKKSKKRFNGLVKLYTTFQDREYSKIEKNKDFRNIYDELLKGEIEDTNLPDGSLFRTDKVYIKKNGKKVHQGVGNGEPGSDLENQIQQELIALIDFMNDHRVPSFEKCFISHYFFEYIHPFYDGNGRVGRFIACSYLSRKLDYLSAISFSSAIKKKRGVYGESFSEASNPRNNGEITGFLIDMMTLLKEGQQSIIDDLSEGESSLMNITRYFETLNFSNEEMQIMHILLQDYLFSTNGRIEDRVLQQIVSEKYSISKRKYKDTIQSLVNEGYLQKIKQRPAIFIFSESLKESISLL